MSVAPQAASSARLALGLRHAFTVRPSLTARFQLWGRPLAVGLTALFAAYGLFVLWTLVSDPSRAALWGVDRGIYVGAVERWLGGGAFYYPYQVVGPYEMTQGVVLYPPVALWFLLPASLLPAMAWRLIPLAIVGAVIRRHRPRAWAWPMIAACLGFQWSVMLFVTANPTLWLAALVALATCWGWPAVAILLKPTLAPFALIGVTRRSWWICLGILAVLCIPFGSMWVDWLQVIEHAQGWRVGPLYSLGDIPWLLAPVIAWIASSGSDRPRPRQAIGSIMGWRRRSRASASSATP